MCLCHDAVPAGAYGVVVWFWFVVVLVVDTLSFLDFTRAPIR